MRRVVLAFLLAVMLVASSVPAAAAPAGTGTSDVAPALADADGDGISDGLQLRLEDLAANERVDVVVTWAGRPDVPRATRAVGPFEVTRRFRLVDGFAARLTAAQIRALAGVPGVFRVEEDFEVSPVMDEANADYGTAAARTAFGVDGSGVRVCVLDTGVDPNHEQTDSQIVAWRDFINNQLTPYDDHYHGTHVASMLLGDGQGPSVDASRYGGVAPGASLLAAKVLNSAGSGSESVIISAIQWCIENNARVFSMSLGTATGSDGQDALSQAVNNAVAQGLIGIIAAGNSGDGPETVGSPGAAEGAITVAAAAKITDGPYLAPFSSRGPTLDGRLKPDITGPGVAIVAANANTGTGYRALSGTSMATPFVAGTVALALQRDPSLTPAGAKALLAATAIDLGAIGADTNWGAGLLDGYAAVAAAGGDSGGIDLPQHFSVTDSVANNGLYTYQFTVEDLGRPIGATILIDGAPLCTLEFAGVCFLWEWSPDLDARLLDPNDVVLAVSECPLNGDCGGMGQQETFHVMPTVAGTYRLEIWPYAGSPNNGAGGGFLFDLFHGPVGTAPPANNAPVAVDDAASTAEDTSLLVAAPGVLGNDTDADGDPLTAALETDPGNGTVNFNSDGSYDYTPAPDFNGTDSFTYRANDGLADSNVATVTITVNPVNDPPVADANGPYAGVEGSPVGFDGSGSFDVDGAITSYMWDFGDGNTGSGVTPTHSYAAAGTYTVTLTVTDDGGATAGDTTTATIAAANNPPVAVDDPGYAMFEDATLNIAAPGVLGNDTDVEGDPLTAVLDTNPANGTLTLNADGSFTYTPNADFNGADSFTYRANDGLADSNVATVTITVNAVNDAPVAVDDAYTTDEDTTLNVAAPGVLGNDSDVDGDGLTAVLDTNPANGTLTLNADGSFSYVPTPGFSGSDWFTYRADDGAAQSTPATVSITVNPAPPPDTMHLGGLSGWSEGLTGGYWVAWVGVLVHDTAHAPLGGATVTGVWGDGTSSSCVTLGDGTCTMALVLRRRVPSVSFTVIGVFAKGLTYAPGDNEVADTVTVFKP